jgi:hypothetical protein
MVLNGLASNFSADERLSGHHSMFAFELKAGAAKSIKGSQLDRLRIRH